MAVGFVVHLNYENPYLSPFEEFQRFKTHPAIREHLRGRQAHRLWRARHHRRRLAVGAEAVLPRRRADRLLRPGFVNVPRIKGSHNAMLSGMLAAEHVAAAIAAGRANDELTAYEDGLARHRHRQGSEDGAQRQAALVALRHGRIGVALGGLDMWTEHAVRRSRPSAR